MTGLDTFTDRLDYPMYVVTAAADGEQSGCLVGFASQNSLHPPRFVVWLSKANHTFGVARRAGFLAVHLLGRDQDGLVALFGGLTGDHVDKFAEVRWRPGEGGAPVLEDARAWFVGRVEDHADWGDHVGFLLSPVEVGPAGEEAAAQPRGALLSLSDVVGLTPGHPA
ncbi:flavin reductase family protein [Streptomyces sp. NPDC051219]|uniref:flavin reductase family protein n=1 Tax=Streptomyces sp. NPDC051219 TaxID=3155283 RepID=UPI0034198AEB